MANYVVLDLETQYSADSCIYCGQEFMMHAVLTGYCLPSDQGPRFTKIGWDNKPALGLSIGCYWDAQDNREHWFDTDTLEATIALLLTRQPLMVSFNGIAFDFPLMRGILRRRAETLPPDDGYTLMQLCDAFKVLAAGSYDILGEIWKLDPESKFERGVNSLDSIAQANGLGAKTGHGAQAPRDWAAGRWAKVLSYCQNDVYLTKNLFDIIWTGQPIKRRGGNDILLPLPIFPAAQA